MMFGLTIEKALIIAVLVGLVFGPERFAHAVQHGRWWVQNVRDWLQQAQHRAATEYGAEVATWTDLDPRRYDPRRIIREALHDDTAPTGTDPHQTSHIARPPEIETEAGTSAPEHRTPLTRRRLSNGHWEHIPTSAPRD